MSSATVQDNRPQLQSVLNRLAGLPANLLAKYNPSGDGSTYPVLAEMLDQAVAWVEDECSTAFNGTWLPPYVPDWESDTDYDFVETPPGQSYATLADGTKVGLERYDGNTTNQIVLRKRPATELALVQVVTPILGYTRVYARDEVKLYVRQGVLKVFTYKLAVEQALLQTVDYQAWGSLFPPLPQAVQVAYCYGFPLYDPNCSATDAITGAPINGPATSFDAGHSWRAGDQRDRELVNWLTSLQEAAVCHCAAMFLGESAGLGRGIAQSVSFDGYSRGLAQAPFASEIQALTARRDELMGRRKRQFYISTIV